MGWCRESQLQPPSVLQVYTARPSGALTQLPGIPCCGQRMAPQEARSSDGLWSSELLGQALSHPRSIAPCHKLILLQFFTFWIIKLSSV